MYAFSRVLATSAALMPALDRRSKTWPAILPADGPGARDSRADARGGGFGDVGQVRKVAEGADHAHRLIAAQILQEFVERTAGLGVALEPVSDRQLCERVRSTRMHPCLPVPGSRREDAPQQSDVLHQRSVLFSASWAAVTRAMAKVPLGVIWLRDFNAWGYRAFVARVQPGNGPLRQAQSRISSGIRMQHL